VTITNLKEYLKYKGFEPNANEKTIILRHGETRKGFKTALRKNILIHYTGFQVTNKNNRIFDSKVKYIVELLPNGMDIGTFHKVYKVKKDYIENKPKFLEDFVKKYPDAFNLDEYMERIYYVLEEYIKANKEDDFNFKGSRNWVRNWHNAEKIKLLQPIDVDFKTIDKNIEDDENKNKIYDKIGEITGVNVGDWFPDRRSLSEAGVHKELQRGIWGSQTKGAYSIVLSGGYEDDDDLGDIIIYTGEGGRDPSTKKQILDQEFSRGNKALAINENEGLPVRVTRGYSHKSSYSPSKGYEYCGLYYVESHWLEEGKSGHRIYRYKLCKYYYPNTKTKFDKEGNVVPHRTTSNIQRIIRDTELARQVKKLYDYCCQICGIRLLTSTGPYAESAHIIPLGTPHDGPDIAENIICLCPNHHVLFDKGSIQIADDFSLIGLDGELHLKREHRIKLEYLQYHRNMCPAIK